MTAFLRTCLVSTLTVALGLPCALTTGCHATPIAAAPTQSPETSPANVGRIQRRPLLRLVHHGAHGQRIGAPDVPEFVLFEDGLLVFSEGDPQHARARQVKLSQQEAYALADRAHEALGGMPETIHASTATDQPMSSIGVTHQGRIYSVTVHGYAGGPPTASGTATPTAFVEVYRQLQGYTHDAAQPYEPDVLEIVMAPMPDDVGGAPWPSAVPVPPADAKQPRDRELSPTQSIPQPVRYRIDGGREAEIKAALESGSPLRWQGRAWRVRSERVMPGGGWFQGW